MNNIAPFLKVLNKIDDILLKVLEPEIRKEQSDILEFVTYSSLDIILGKAILDVMSIHFVQELSI